MEKLSIFIIVILLITGCTTNHKISENHRIPELTGNDQPQTIDSGENGNISGSAEQTPIKGFTEIPAMEKLGELPGGHISDIVFSPNKPNIAYLASNVNAMGIWRSEDTGETWKRVYYDDNFAGTHVNTLAISPSNGDIVLAVDLHGRVSKTTDGGETWKFVYGDAGGGSELQLFSLAVSPSNPKIYYAGDINGRIIKSTDAGESWKLLDAVVSPGGVGSLIVDSSDSNVVFAGTREGVFKSVNGGLSFIVSSSQDFEVVGLASAKQNTVFAATVGGIFLTTDGGGKWIKVLNEHSHSVEVSPSNPNIVYAGTNNGVYKSTDGGQTWKKTNNGVQYLDIGPIAIHPENPDAVLTGTNMWEWSFHHDPIPESTTGEGIYKTQNGGAQWTRIIGNFFDRDVIAIAVDQDNPNYVYVGTECSRGLFRSSNGGSSWSFSVGGPQGMQQDIAHYTMKLTTDKKSNVFLTGRFGVAKSSDHAVSWNTNDAPRRHFHGIAVSPYDNNFIIAGTSPDLEEAAGTVDKQYTNAHIVKSTDGGLSWRESGTGFPSGTHTSVHDVGFDPTDPSIIYISTTHEELGGQKAEKTLGVYKSADKGETWTAVNNGLKTLDVDSVQVNHKGVVFAGTDDGVFISRNKGESWSQTSLDKEVEIIAIDPIGTIFVGTKKNGLFVSFDDSATWSRVESVPEAYVSGIAIDAKGTTIYAVVNGVGVFKNRSLPR